ncbi:MAG: sulfite exporter TauE/SafE family protein [Patescibacteria group bacterium]
MDTSIVWWALVAAGFTSAFNCVALQMGLLASVIASRNDGKNSLYAAWATGAFLVSKLIAYTLLGVLLGWFGESVSISEETSTLIELVAGFYVVLAALAVLNIHPFFRYFVIQPPRFLTRFVSQTSKKGDLLTPAFLGAMTVFIPCGTTVAVEALALHHGTPILGGLVMGVFTLGTMPVFMAFGAFADFARGKWGARFDKISAIIVLALGALALSETVGELVGGE